MAVLIRLHDFIPGSLIQSSQVDAEFNQLVNLLSGVSTNKDALIKYSHATDPPLALDQLGTGLVQQWKVGGAEKARVNNTGAFQTVHQFISTLAIGTKPIDVTSTTVCTNLNADLLDGLHATSFVRNDAANAGTVTFNGAPPFVIGSAQLVANLNADLLDGLNSSVFVRNDTASQIVVAPFTVDGTTDIVLKSNGQIVGYPRTIHVNTAATGNVGAGTDVLHTFNLPAGSLAAAGDYLIIEHGGFFAANDRNKVVTTVFGGNTVEDGGLGIDLDGGSNNGWRMIYRIVRLTNTTVRVSSGYYAQFATFDSAATVSTFNTGGAFFHRNATHTVAALDVNAITIEVKGGATDGTPADDDVVANLTIIQLVQMS